MEPRLSFVTLGVSDLKRATRFYEEVLRLPRIQTPPEVSFFRTRQDLVGTVSARAVGGGRRGSRGGLGLSRFHVGA